jgi:sec-independent protein translocase protein TatC
MALVPFPGSAAPAPPDPEPHRPGLDDEDADSDATAKMSFLEHLDELRKRLIVSAVALAVGFLVGLSLVWKIRDFVLGPLHELSGSGLLISEPAEGFLIDLKIAALAGLMMAAPVVLWQFWLFIAPGLYAHEKKFAIPFVLFSTFFFVAGAAFSHYIVFRVAWQFFATYASDYVTFMPRLSATFSMYVKLLLAFGLVFQIPTLVFFLARMGMVTPRFLWRHTKYAVLIVFVIAAVITPTADPVTQTLTAAPMLVLYMLSIGIAWVFQKRSRD